MNAKKIKKIRRFGKLRFGGVTKKVPNPIQGQPPMEVPFDPKILIAIYKKADKKKQRELDKEMDDYFEAIDKGLIQPGESLLNAAVGKLPPTAVKSVEDVEEGGGEVQKNPEVK